MTETPHNSNQQSDQQHPTMASSTGHGQLADSLRDAARQLCQHLNDITIRHCSQQQQQQIIIDQQLSTTDNQQPSQPHKYPIMSQYFEVYKKYNFDKTFYDKIASDVIRFLSPQLLAEPHNPTYDEANIYQHLIGPLEKFVLGDNTFETIQSLNTPSKLCRRTLKLGDVTFSCNDCALDDTCVVCIDCFHKSAHKDHNYRMFNSDGGGCCDCGDAEAWTQNYACSDHVSEGQRSLTLSNFEDYTLRAQQINDDKKTCLDTIARLPEGVASRYFLICQAALNYALTMLPWTGDFALPRRYQADREPEQDIAHLLSDDQNSDNFFTVLYNDEVHTYDYVINALVRIIKCSKITASIMASTVSREGRSFIMNGNYEACKQVQGFILNIKDGTQGPLKVKVTHGCVLAHQAFALKLIDWVRKMASVSDSFRTLTAYSLMGIYDSELGMESTQEFRPITLVEHIMLYNTKFWRIVRVEWNDLFVKTLLTDYSIKEQFARLLTRIYPTLMNEFILDDHEHSVSILTMTTQLYTVPSLLCMLIEEENALAIIMNTLFNLCKAKKRENPAVSLDSRSTFEMAPLRRGFHIISDLRHLINIEPTKWTPKLKHNVIEAVKIFLNLLNLMQGMDSVRRQLGQHLEYEPDWESGMILQSRLDPFITKLVTFCSYDKSVLVAVLKDTEEKLSKHSHYKRITQSLLDYQTSCIQYDVATSVSGVSVHLPLTRFASALILQLMMRRPSDKEPYDENLILLGESERGKPRQLMMDIMEPSLRTAVMIAQFRSGMWRRNGYSLVNQISYYHSPITRREMFDRDVQLLQACGAMYEANKFLIHLLNKFHLLAWVNTDLLTPMDKFTACQDEEYVNHTSSLGEEFLQLVLTIVGERYQVGVGKIEPQDVMRNELIQLLCIRHLTRSELTHKLHVNDNELDCIKSVANLKRSTENSTGRYELKVENYEKYNPFFYHYNRRQQSNALEAQLKRKKTLKEALICCPPPKPVELTPQFKNLNQILKCDILLTIIAKILSRVLNPPEKVGLKKQIKFGASDLQLDQSLHLIGLGLHEQERSPTEFDYIQAAHSKGIFSLLKDCYDKENGSKDLILWLMKKTNEIYVKLDPTTQVSLLAVKEYTKPAMASSDAINEDMKRKNSEMAAQRRERIMQMMKSKQEKFLSNPFTKQLAAETERNEAPLAAHSSSYPSSSAPGSSSNSSPAVYTTRSGRKSKPPKSIAGYNKALDLSSTRSENLQTEDVTMDYESDEHVDNKSLNEERELCNEFGGPFSSHLCILCRDEQIIGFNKQTMVMLAYIQRSAVLSKNRTDRRIPNYDLTPTNHIKYMSPSKFGYSFTSDNGLSFDASLMPADLFFGPHMSTCGHVMHYECWLSFFDTIQKRENLRNNRSNHPHISYELDKYEILCPLCECISNATIPLLPNYTRFDQDRASKQSVFDVPSEAINDSAANLSACLRALGRSVASTVPIKHINELKLLQPRPINEVLENIDEADALKLRDFIKTMKGDKICANICSGDLLNSVSNLAERIHTVSLDLNKTVTSVDHARIFMMTAWSISYTVQSHERVARFKGSPILEDVESSRSLGLSALLRFANTSMITLQSDMTQSLLVRKLRYLIVKEEHQSSSPCCLDIDAFETFVSLSILIQKLYAHLDGSMRETHINKSSSSPTPSEAASSSESYAWTTRAYNHEYFRSLLHLSIVLNLVQVIISLHKERLDVADQKGTSQQEDRREHAVGEEFRTLTKFYKEMILAAGFPTLSEPTDDEEAFCCEIKARLLPFMRSCAIYFYNMSQIEAPQVLRTKSAFCESQELQDTKHTLSDETTRNEFDAICSYLSMPSSFVALLQSSEARHLARSWLHHPRVQFLIKSPATGSTTDLMPVRLIRQPHHVNRLIDLPYDYSELVDRVSDFTCPSIKNEDSRTPTMCLICGLMLCSQSYCCQRDLNELASNYKEVQQQQQQDQFARDHQNSHPHHVTGPHGAHSHHQQAAIRSMPPSQRLQQLQGMIFSLYPPQQQSQQLVGSCTYHAHECSAGVGVFLRIRNCQILLLSGKSKGCYMPAPYIDDHGETDNGLIRGNPLYLNKQHYEKLQQMWLSHSIPEQVSRTLEYSLYASSTNWHLH